MKKIYLFLLLLLSCGSFAQDVDEGDVRRQDEVSDSVLLDNLQKEKKLLSDSLVKQKEKLYNLKLSWYNTCVSYLRRGHFKSEELVALIGNTRINVDGDALYNELIRAKDCFDANVEYVYADVTPPSMETTKTEKDGNDKKNQKKKKTPLVKTPKERTESPIVSPNPEDDLIEVDPDKDKPGNDKKDTKTPKTEKPLPVDTESPKTTPPDTKEEKKPKKTDKGELGEGKSKMPKNEDGSFRE